MAKGRKGFTLLELLILVVVIALLAALLFPVFARARRSARGNVCIHNLRQLAAGLLMYAQDNDGRAPGVGHPYASGAWAGGWPRNEYVLWEVMIDPYVGNRTAFNCPDAINSSLPNEDWDGWYLVGVPLPADWDGVPVSYGINVLLQLSYRPPRVSDYDGGSLSYWGNSSWDTFPNTWFNYANMAQGPGVGMDPSTGWGGRNLCRLQKPSEVVLLSDASGPVEACYQKVNTTQICGWQTPTCSLEDPVAQDWATSGRHKGGNNWAFADGHVKWNRAGVYSCIPGQPPYEDAETTALDADILSGNTLQRLHGVDQLN